MIAAGLTVWLGYSHGRRFTSSDAEHSEQRKAVLLAIAPIILLAVFALSIWARMNVYEKAMTNASERELRFAELSADNQKVASSRVAYDSDEDLRAIIEIAGRRTGSYRLQWRVSPSSFDNAVISGSRELELYEGESQVDISFTLGELRSGYQAEILNGGTGVLVDEPFQFDVSLEPVLRAEEITDLPPGEQQRLRVQDSPLVSSAAARFPVYFVIP